MLAHMSAVEFTEWRLYDATVEPLPDRRGDLRAATIVATLLNLSRSHKQRVISAEEVALDFEKPAPLSHDKVRAIMGALTTKRRAVGQQDAQGRAAGLHQDNQAQEPPGSLSEPPVEGGEK
jgi:hypothetical protein